MSATAETGPNVATTPACSAQTIEAWSPAMGSTEEQVKRIKEQALRDGGCVVRGWMLNDQACSANEAKEGEDVCWGVRMMPNGPTKFPFREGVTEVES